MGNMTCLRLEASKWPKHDSQPTDVFARELAKSKDIDNMQQ